MRRAERGGMRDGCFDRRADVLSKPGAAQPTTTGAEMLAATIVRRAGCVSDVANLASRSAFGVIVVVPQAYRGGEQEEQQSGAGG